MCSLVLLNETLLPFTRKKKEKKGKEKKGDK